MRVPSGYVMDLGLGKLMSWWKICVIPWRLGQGMRGDCKRWSATELEERMGRWVWRRGGRDENLKIDYLLPWFKFPENAYWC